MGRKEEYKLQNEQYLEALRAEEDIKELPCGIFYRVLESGNGDNTPRLNSIVTVHYKGTLINGREFDIPYTMGYGTRSSGPIPAFSTLVFEVQLLGIA